MTKIKDIVKMPLRTNLEFMSVTNSNYMEANSRNITIAKIGNIEVEEASEKEVSEIICKQSDSCVDCVSPNDPCPVYKALSKEFVILKRRK